MSEASDAELERRLDAVQVGLARHLACVNRVIAARRARRAAIDERAVEIARARRNPFLAWRHRP